jgi:anti-anti-sigma factor
MELISGQSNGVMVVTIRGSVDALTAGQVQGYFDDLLEKGERQIILDLSQVDFMSSAGLRVIMTVSKNLRQDGGELRLAAAQPSVEKMLKISGFTTILKSFASLDAALGSFQG